MDWTRGMDRQVDIERETEHDEKEREKVTEKDR